MKHMRDIKTVARIIAVIAVMVIALSGGAAHAADPGPELCFELVDGSVISGRIDAKAIAFKVSGGSILKIPPSELREFYVGLNDRLGLARRVETLIKALDSDDTRQAARRELAAIGPCVNRILKRHASSDVAARRDAIAKILKANESWWYYHPNAAPAMSREFFTQSIVVAGGNKFVGKIAVDEFRITHPCGRLTVKLKDILLIRPGARTAGRNLTGWWDVELPDRTHIKCKPINPSLRVKTRYGTLLVPRSRIQQATFGADGKSVRVKCWGSGRIVGALGPGTKISLKTLKGRVDMAPGKIAVMAYGPFSLRGHRAGLNSIAFSPDGKRMVSGGWRDIKIWDIAAGKELITLKGHPESVWAVDFSPDGKRVASGHWDGNVRLWNSVTGKKTFTLKGEVLDGGAAAMVECLAFSGDGKRLASGGYKNVRVWDCIGGNELFRFEACRGAVLSVVYSPDGKRIAAGGDHGPIKLWNAAKWGELLTVKGESNYTQTIAFSADGKLLASVRRGFVQVWDSTTGKELLSIKRPSVEMRSVAFSPDGKILASGGGCETIKLHDVATGKELGSLETYSGWAMSLAFFPDGKRLAAGCSDGTIKFLEIPDSVKAKATSKPVISNQ